MPQENAGALRGVRYPISLPTERAGKRRSLDERFFVRFPAAYRLLSAAVARLSPRSRLRRSIIKYQAGRGAAAPNRRDFVALLLRFDQEIEYRPRGDIMALDMDSVFHGHDGYQRVWQGMMDAFEDFWLDPVELLDLGDWMLATVEVKGHGSGSGVPVTERLFQLFKLRRGMIVWQQDFADRDTARSRRPFEVGADRYLPARSKTASSSSSVSASS
jgi:hypothetical protein